MTTVHHVPHGYHADLTSAEINRPLGELDAAIETVITTGSGTSTTLTAQASAGQASLTVGSSAGFAHDDSIYIGTGAMSESRIVDTAGGTTITVTVNLSNTYAAGKPVSKSPVEIVAARKGYTTLGGRMDSRERGVLYAVDYGVTANGTTDDYAAMQAFLSAFPAVGGKGVLPSGIIKITAALTAGNGGTGDTIRLVGQGGHAWAGTPTIINQVTLSTRALTSTASETWLEHIAFVGPGGAPTISEGVYATYNIHMVGVTISGFYTGLRTNGAGSYYCSVTDCRFNANTFSGLRSDGNNLTVLNSRTTGGSYGIHVSQGASVRIIGCAFEQHTGYPILVDAAYGVLIQGCYFESTTGTPGASIFIGPAAACYSTTIIGNFFAADGGIAGFHHIRLDHAVGTLIAGNKFGQATGGAFLFSANTLYVTRLENRIEAGNIGSVSAATETVSIGQGSIAIGGGTAITKHLSGTATWDPGSLIVGAQAYTSVTVTGAVIGDTVAVGFSVSQLTMILSGYVSAPDLVTVVLYNAASGGTRDLGSGTLRADVWKH